MKKSNKVLLIALAGFLAIAMALLFYFAVTVRRMVDKETVHTAQHHEVTTGVWPPSGCA